MGLDKAFCYIALSLYSSIGYADTYRYDIVDESDELECLALNIYFEARGSILADKIATGDVVLNRVDDVRYPNTVCAVVKDAEYSAWHKERGKISPIRNKCQFSWWCDGKSDNPVNEDRWEESLLIAYKLLHTEKWSGITSGATHYHADYVTPYWADSLHKIGRIGSHVYYRWD